MPKQQKIPFCKKVNAFANRHKVLSVIAFVVVVLALLQAAVSTINYFRINAERKQFSQTKSDLDELYAQIVKQFGEPSQHKSIDFCSYTSREFGRGARSCTMERNLFYENVNSDSASKMLQELSSSIDSVDGLSVGSHLSSLPQDNGTKYKELTGYKILINGSDRFQCTMSATAKDNGFLPCAVGRLNAEKSGLLIDYGCVRSAKTEYFPVSSN